MLELAIGVWSRVSLWDQALNVWELMLIPRRWASLVAQAGKNLPTVQETQVQSLGGEDPLEEEMQPALAISPGEFHRQRSLVGSIQSMRSGLNWTVGYPAGQRTGWCGNKLIHLVSEVLWVWYLGKSRGNGYFSEVKQNTGQSATTTSTQHSAALAVLATAMRKK